MNRRAFGAGGPAALGAASRNKLGEDFVQALAGDFEKNGPAVIERVRLFQSTRTPHLPQGTDSSIGIAKPPLRGLRQGSAQWLRPELRVRVRHLKAKGTLCHATVTALITD